MPTQKSGIHIRKARLKDLPAVLDIYAGALDGGQSVPEAEARKIFRRMKSYPNYQVYVAVGNRQVVGTFALLIMDNLAKRGTPSGIVEDVAVLPEWQGRGVGKRMMSFALDVCRKAGCYKMVLSSNTRRASAHRFYESLGFRKHGYSFRVDLDADERR